MISVILAEILCASDELTRVIDSYKEKVLLQKIESNLTKPYNIQMGQNLSKNIQTGNFKQKNLIIYTRVFKKIIMFINNIHSENTKLYFLYYFIYFSFV